MVFFKIFYSLAGGLGINISDLWEVTVPPITLVINDFFSLIFTIMCVLLDVL